MIPRHDHHKIGAELQRQRVQLRRLTPARALATLEEAELKDELGLDARTLHTARQKLKARGVVSSAAVRLATASGSHIHSSRLTRWDQLVPASKATTAEALAQLAVAGVHAAVLARRAEVARWFAWRINSPIIDELVESGRLRTVGDSLAASAP